MTFQDCEYVTSKATLLLMNIVYHGLSYAIFYVTLNGKRLITYVTQQIRSFVFFTLSNVAAFFCGSHIMQDYELGGLHVDTA